MNAVLLAGHGSHVSPNTAGLVWSWVDRLRAQNVADEIGACFWKEPPSFRKVLDSLCADTVVVVPALAADGYFARTVIPGEMGLEGPLTCRASRRIHYTAPLGLHPRLGDDLRRRVLRQMKTLAIEAEEVAVAVIGHGTRRDPRSRYAARQMAQSLAGSLAGVEVLEAYLDDDPPIQSIYERTQAQVILAAPWFVAPGSHVSTDVPQALGLEAGASSGRCQGRSVYYLDAPGTAEVACDLILELARAAVPAIEARRPAGAWRAFPGRGAQALWSRVQESGEMEFGELLLSPDCVRPAGQGGTGSRVTTPGHLRRLVRERPFRPLPEARGMPNGWYVEVGDAGELAAVVETVYPGALADWDADRSGTLTTVTLQELAARQPGKFRALDRIPQEKVNGLVASLCESCVRQPTWYGVESEVDGLPCREPCNFWLSRASGERA